MVPPCGWCVVVRSTGRILGCGCMPPLVTNRKWAAERSSRRKLSKLPWSCATNHRSCSGQAGGRASHEAEPCRGGAAFEMARCAERKRAWPRAADGGSCAVHRLVDCFVEAVRNAALAFRQPIGRPRRLRLLQRRPLLAHLARRLGVGDPAAKEGRRDDRRGAEQHAEHRLAPPAREGEPHLAHLRGHVGAT
eukprot:1076517-Prymnesium_polylepis.2